MYHIMVTCPSTGKHVATGVSTDRDGFVHLPGIPGVISGKNCPHCGFRHAWTTADAWLEGKTQYPTARLAE